MKVDVEPDAPGGLVRVVIVTQGRGRAAGKCVCGRWKNDPERRALVFDDAAEFHIQIGSTYGVEVVGGGWIEFDQANRTAVVSHGSTQFGREPDRRLTVELLRTALPDYRVEAV